MQLMWMKKMMTTGQPKHKKKKNLPSDTFKAKAEMTHQTKVKKWKRCAKENEVSHMERKSG